MEFGKSIIFHISKATTKKKFPIFTRDKEDPCITYICCFSIKTAITLLRKAQVLKLNLQVYFC